VKKRFWLYRKVAGIKHLGLMGRSFEAVLDANLRVIRLLV